MRTSQVRVLALGLLVAAGGLFASAALADESFTFSKLAFWRKPWPPTLIVTGNFARSRLLAELAQRKTDMPVLLISQEEGGDQLYYMPSNPETMALPPEKYMEFIETMLRPKRIVFVGDASYVPPNYIEVVKQTYPTIVISGQDWNKNAGELGRVLRSRTLAPVYRKALRALEEAEKHRETIDPSAPVPVAP